MPRARLDVSAPPGTEVAVLDSGLRLVARGLGDSTFDLEAGIYKVKATAGRLTTEKVVALRSGTETVTFSVEDLPYYSPVPLPNTRRVNTDHLREATARSRERHVRLGNGSSVFVFARGYDSPHVNPANGLALTDSEGVKLVDIPTAGAASLGTDRPWAACAIELDPGPYRLRLDCGEKGLFEQTVVASPGFQTQIFLPQRSYAIRGEGETLEPSFAADILKASILMSRSGFEPNAPDTRLDDLARIALADQRNLDPTAMRSLFGHEHNNPMFGIYGGHLLLLAREVDRATLADVVGFLRLLLAMPHPDVEALALELGQAPQPPWDVFAIPPMLVSSWAIVARHSASETHLVPKGSLSARTASTRWGAGPWYVWNAQLLDQETSDEWSVDEVSTLDSLAALTTDDGGAHASLEMRRGGLGLGDVASRARSLSPIESGVYRTIRRSTQASRRNPDAPTLSWESLSRDMEMPLAAVQQAASGLGRKLSRALDPGAGVEGVLEALVSPIPRPVSFGSCVEWVPDVDPGTGTERPALARQFQWSLGATITCAFMDGDPIVHRRVREVAKLWERYANLTFAFTPRIDNADVRITFSRAGASSVLGTACKRVPKNEATMVLGDVKVSTSVAEVWRLVLHEFGHAIGLIHEHQNPAGGIHWNKAVAEEYYRQLTGWPAEKIERNIFRAYEKDVTQFAFTAVDRTSIMMYPIPKELTLDGFEVGWNCTISSNDTAFVREMYPGRMKEEPPVVPPVFTNAASPEVPEPATASKITSVAHNSVPPTSSERREMSMATTEDQLRRIREFNKRLRGADKALDEELPNPGAGDANLTLEAFTPESSLDAQLELETIVLRRGRPVLTIANDTTLVVFRDKDDSAIWKDRLTSAKAVIDAAIRAVGRVEVAGHALSWLGTGWLVDSDILVTNRHVAREFTSRREQSFVFRMADSGESAMSASVDFLQEYDNPRTLVFRLVRPLFVEAEGGPDLAFFEVEQQSGSGGLAQPIRLSDRAPSVTPSVAVIGYPASDSRIPDYDLMIRTFGSVFDKKRLAPGGVTRVEGTQILHDCSTLGGNSGSVVLDLTRGEAVGLHFSGRFLTANYAVRADVVRKRLAELRSGSLTRARSTAQPRGPKQPEAALVASSTAGAVSITIPLVVTVSLGAQTTTAAARPIAGGPRATPQGSLADGEDEGDELDEGLEGVAADYADRMGYDASFLGKKHTIEIPEVVRAAKDVLVCDLDGQTGTVLTYEHFSVVMSRSRRLCFFSAVNIDGGISRKTRRGPWRWDPRIPKSQQIMKECYGNPPKFSRGHMTRREDPGWGPPRTATRGADDSMHVTNAVPQMQAFNSPIWLQLEDYALQNAREDDMKISVFTGPFFTKNDPVMHGVRIPTSFWKIIVFIHDETSDLSATGYIMEQGDQLPDQELVFGQFLSTHLKKTVQVPISTIEKRSGLRFDRLADLDVFGAEEESVDGTAAPIEIQLDSLEQIRFVR